jgi:hypothetical protein
LAAISRAWGFTESLGQIVLIAGASQSLSERGTQPTSRPEAQIWRPPDDRKGQTTEIIYTGKSGGARCRNPAWTPRHVTPVWFRDSLPIRFQDVKHLNVMAGETKKTLKHCGCAFAHIGHSELRPFQRDIDQLPSSRRIRPADAGIGPTVPIPFGNVHSVMPYCDLAYEPHLSHLLPVWILLEWL